MLIFMKILEGVVLIISFVDILLSFSSEECSIMIAVTDIVFLQLISLLLILSISVFVSGVMLYHIAQSVLPV